ncbi:MAG: methylase [Treponema sp.]|jgi:hypothetical protein|nr:methylase [Treponema sp.]
MPLSWNEIRLRAAAFVSEWREKAPAAREEADAQTFMAGFLAIFSDDSRKKAQYEYRVALGSEKTLFGVQSGGMEKGYIDLLWKAHILIEMKSPGKDLKKAFEQARTYAAALSAKDFPQGILVCDFVHFHYYDYSADLPLTPKEIVFTLETLPERLELFGFLAGYQSIDFSAISPVDLEAAGHMGDLYTSMIESGYSGHQLEMYLVRLLFCLFADDTGIFDEKKLFFTYIHERTSADGSDLAMHLSLIFETMNKPREKRLKTIDEQLNKFSYIDGGLFEEHLETASFTSAMRHNLLKCGTLDWSQIKPEIFGAMFQSVKDKEKRRALGEHYTSEQNILKVIRPLFLDALHAEFKKIKLLSGAQRKQRLREFHQKLGTLRFLDPACGCGNFLVVSYRELRLLEMEVVRELLAGEKGLDLDMAIIVNVNQCYGIEIEEFPARIAQTALWLVDHLMNNKVSAMFQKAFVRIPLKASPNIIIGDALVEENDWEKIVPKKQLSYILGNPPFVGKKEQSKRQKSEVYAAFPGVRGAGVLDYVACWYKKAALYMQGTNIEAAFVSTNSICQGEQVSALWSELMHKHGVKINFAHQSFKWTNEAKGKAAVFCVIIGFSLFDRPKKQLFQYAKNNVTPVEVFANAINAYLVDGPQVFLEARSKPISKAPEMCYGSMPIDDGHLILSAEEAEHFLKTEPVTKKMIRPYYGGEEFINNKKRFCLWLQDIDPSLIDRSKLVKERIRLTQQFRAASPRETTRNLSAAPSLFGEIRQPAAEYLVIPKVSSSYRKYIPMGFLNSRNITNGSALIVPDATLYAFGVLTSAMHMTWMRYVGGRIGDGYQYSASLVYNNFPWPDPTEKKKAAIASAAQKVLDARALFPKAALAVLYNPLSMPAALLAAHKKLDHAVEAAYGREFASDAERAAYLFEVYQRLAGELFVESKRRGKGRKLR